MPRHFVPVRQDPDKMRFIEWLTTPPAARVPGTEREFAAELDVHLKTLYNWKQDREFREVWQGETDVVVGDLDKRQRILDTLYEVATDPHNPRHVQASKEYLAAIRAITPPELNPDGTELKAIGLLTEAELDRYIASGLADLSNGG